MAHQKIACDDLSWDQKNTIMHMMNAKPDIAVIYYDEEKRENKLLFLECKFESYESSSQDGHKQSDIQWKIADFLCKHYLKEKIGIADKMDEEKSCIVKFVRKKVKTRKTQMK